MMINSPSAMQYQAIQQQRLHTAPPNTAQTTVQSTVASADTATISSEAQRLGQVEQGIVGKYDVTNMSPADMREMSKELNANGLITDEERLNMSFELRLDNLLGMSYDENKPVNHLQQFQNRYEFSKQSGGTAAHNKMLENMMGLMERYKGMQNTG